MGYLEIKNLTKKFGDFTAVNNVSLSLEKGEMIALLGGSGCGKTTILRQIAGFITPTEGEVIIDGKVMNKIPSYKRNVGIFFQNYALFPHMTVFDNVAYSLKLKKLPKAQIEEKVMDMLHMVKLDGLDKRYPRELSGGQQQRVALARALVMEPKVLLLDEPLSNLDAKLRIEMQVEIKRLQRELGLTTIVVTHDQEEAISMADRVVIMNAGVIQQVGGAKQVFDHPESQFVADFMGYSNFIEGVVESKENGKAVVKNAFGTKFVAAADGVDKVEVGDKVMMTIRPEHIILEQNGENNNFIGKISTMTYKGNMTRVDIADVFDCEIHSHAADYDGPAAGRAVRVHLPEDQVILFPVK